MDGEPAEALRDYKVDVRSLPKDGHPVLTVASDAEREELRRMNELLSVESLRVDARVMAWRGEGVRVVGTIDALVRQSCVATLEPVEGKVHDSVDITVLPSGSPLAHRSDGEIVFDPEGDDPPDVFTPPYVDVGRIAEELFTLALDDYPRVSDAELPAAAKDEEGTSPFAALQALRVGDAD